MANQLSYFIMNELYYRLRKSILLWCYFGCIFLVFFPNILSSIFLKQLIDFAFLPNSILFLFLLFFPINFDIFNREENLNMIDYVVMSSGRMKSVYFSRIIANAVLMVIPIIAEFLILFTIELINDSLLSLPIFFFYLIIISLFFLLWYLIAMLVLLVIELRFTASITRVILYFMALAIIYSTLVFIKTKIYLVTALVEVFLGQLLFENIFISILFIFISSIVFLLLLLFMITKRINFMTQKLLLADQELKKKIKNSKNMLYSILGSTGFSTKSQWERIIPYFGFVPYLAFYILESDPMKLEEIIMTTIGVHFFIILLYVLLIVFPRITMEKEFNMEELILSRISADSYFFQKFSLILRRIFFPMLIMSITVVLVSRTSLNPYITIAYVLIIRAFYFTSVLTFIWRMFPVRSLLESAIFSLFGLEILGIFLSRFLIPPAYIVFSPLISSITISRWLFDPTIVESIYTSYWMISIITIVFFLASLVLIKSEVRFE